MAAAPRFKIYTASGEYIAACKYAEDAAAIVAVNGNGATIRDGHRVANIVWTEGAEEFSAGESYDRAANVIFDRTNSRKG